MPETCLILIALLCALSPREILASKMSAAASSACEPESILFANGARTSKWGPIGSVQSRLHLRADGVYGRATESAVAKWKTQNGLTGPPVLDECTWRSLMESDPPSIEERSEALTFTLEGTDYD
jgi:peptidoglycan hydrolase-like protein with peptidoglycan-binding domain